MNRTPTTLFNGSHRAAAEMKRRMRQLLDKKTLGTKYSADETPESDSLPEYADEVDEMRRDSNIGKWLVLLIAVCAALGAAAYLVG